MSNTANGSPIKIAVKRMAFPQEVNEMSIAEALELLDRVTEIPGQLPEQLEHFLQRRSYVKAWDWIERHPEWTQANHG